MKRLTAAFLAAFLFFCGCGGAVENNDSPLPQIALGSTGAPKLVLTITSNQTSDENPYHFGLERFKETAETLSNGEIEVRCHNGTLSENEYELVQMLREGEVQLIVTSPGFMTSLGVPEVDMLSLLYLFNNFNHWERCMDGDFGRAMRDIILSKTDGDFRIMGYWTAGVRDYYGKMPIKTPADCKDITIRTQTSGVVYDFWKQCGAVPTQVEWGSLYGALNSGQVDSAENDYTNFMLKDHHKTKNGKYICETHHDFTTRLFLMNGNLYDSLTEEQRGWIDEAAAAATAQERRVTYSMADASKQRCIADGATVIGFADMDIEAFRAIALPIQDEYAVKNGMEQYLEMVRSAS